MTENPFIVVGRIKPENFCDRVEESRRLIRCVTNGGNMVLMSPRRVGKTQLIDFCFNKPQIRDHYTTIFIDILKTTTLNELIYELGKAVFNTLAPRGQKMIKIMATTMSSLTAKVGFDPLTGLPTFGISIGDIRDPVFTLEEIFKTLEAAGQRCIIAIDEFQQIRNYPEKNIEALLRTYIQRQEKTRFIFAGSERHLLEEMFLEPARPFYNSADTMMMDVIEEGKYADFVRHHFEANDKHVADEAVSYVYHTFGGNTYYNQKTFREAFAITANGSTCTQETAEYVIGQMTDDNDRRYSEILARLSLPQKELLYAIATEGRARQITSGRFIRQHSLGSASSVQSAVKKLIPFGLVSQENGEYYIADQLMGLWLKRK